MPGSYCNSDYFDLGYTNLGCCDGPVPLMSRVLLRNRSKPQRSRLPIYEDLKLRKEDEKSRESGNRAVYIPLSESRAATQRLVN